MAYASTFFADPDEPVTSVRAAHVPWWMIATLALILTLHAVRTWQVNATQPTDFLIFYEASIDLHQGADPYRIVPTHLPYIYPPLLAWMFGPLTMLPLMAAAQVWTAVSFVAWLVLGAVAVKLSRSDHGARGAWLAVLPSLLAYRFVLRLNLHGQVDLALWALVSLSALALYHRRDRTSGGLLGLALVIKPLPVLFAGALVLRRRWTAAAVAIGTAALLLAAPALTEGPARNRELLQQWVGGRIGTDLTDVGFEVHHSNQSLQAFLYRYTAQRRSPAGAEQSPASMPGSPGKGSAPAADELGEPWPAPVAAIAPSSVNLCWAALVLAIVLPLPFLIRSGPTSRRRYGVEIALLAITTHLFSRRTMEYHLVSLVLVDCVLLGLALCPGIALRWRRAAGLTLFAAALLQNFYSPMFVGRAASRALQSRSFTTASMVLIWGFLCLCLSRWESVTRVHTSQLPQR